MSPAPAASKSVAKPSGTEPLNIDIHDPSDQQKAQPLHHQNDGDQDVAKEVLKHRLDQIWPHVVENQSEKERHRRDHPALQSARGRDSIDLSFLAKPLARGG